MTSGDRKGRSPLIIASIYGYVNVVGLIIKEIIHSSTELNARKIYIDFQDYKGRSSLFHAAANGHLNVVNLLVGSGADLDIKTNKRHAQPGSTPLMASVEKNELPCFEFLLEHGASIFALREDGADALYIAARYGHKEIIDRFSELEEFSFLVNRPTFRRRTPIIPAAFHGHALVCKILFPALKELDHQDVDGATALMYASIKGNMNAVKWLLSYGSNIHIKNKAGETALSYAICGGQRDVVQYLKRVEKKQDTEKEN